MCKREGEVAVTSARYIEDLCFVKRLTACDLGSQCCFPGVHARVFKRGVKRGAPEIVLLKERMVKGKKERMEGEKGRKKGKKNNERRNE